MSVAVRGLTGAQPGSTLGDANDCAIVLAKDCAREHWRPRDHSAVPVRAFCHRHPAGREEIAIRDTVRKMVDDRIRPHVGEWFEAAALPARELAKELGALGVLGMHLEATAVPG